LALTRRGKRARLSVKEDAQIGNSGWNSPPLDLLEVSERTCSLTQSIEFPILQRLADGLSIYSGLNGT
jgi:hypothetical protein